MKRFNDALRSRRRRRMWHGVAIVALLAWTVPGWARAAGQNTQAQDTDEVTLDRRSTGLSGSFGAASADAGRVPSGRRVDPTIEPTSPKPLRSDAAPPYFEFTMPASYESFELINSADQIEVILDLTVNYGGDPNAFRWSYRVKNNSYNPWLSNGLSGLHFEIVPWLPPELRDITGPTGDWSGEYMVAGPYWSNQYGEGLGPGQHGFFGYTTGPRVPRRRVMPPGEAPPGYYNSHFYGAPSSTVYFANGLGPKVAAEPLIVEACDPHTFINPLHIFNCRSGLEGNGPFDFDNDQDGTVDSWNFPVFLCRDGGGFWPLTDEAGNSLYLIGRDVNEDTGQRGCQFNHFEYRFRAGGAPANGVIVGTCAMKCGENITEVTFDDFNANGVPDRFLKVQHRNLGYPNDGRRCLWEAGPDLELDFTSDLTADKVIPSKVLKILQRSQAATVCYSIVDAVMVPLGTYLPAVVLDGEPIGTPADSLGEEFVGIAATAHSEMISAVQDGAAVTIEATLANQDTVIHEYRFSLFGIGVDVDSLNPVSVGQGEVVTYQLHCRLTAPTSGDTVAVLSYAYAETGAMEDNALGVLIYASSPVVDVTQNVLPATQRVTLIVTPNPLKEKCSISWRGRTLQADVIEVFDVRGRVINRIPVTKPGRNAGSEVWEGHDNRGRPVPSGVYSVCLRRGQSILTTVRAIVLR